MLISCNKVFVYFSIAYIQNYFRLIYKETDQRFTVEWLSHNVTFKCIIIRIDKAYIIQLLINFNEQLLIKIYNFTCIKLNGFTPNQTILTFKKFWNCILLFYKIVKVKRQLEPTISWATMIFLQNCHHLPLVCLYYIILCTL